MASSGFVSAEAPGSGLIRVVQQRMHEVWRFLAVGLASTVLEFALFNLLILGVGLGPVWSKVIATSVAMANAYLGNRCWSFRHRPRTGARREAPRFLLVNAAGLAIGAAVVGFAHTVVGVESMLALNIVNVVTVAVVMVFRFWAYHHWVFPTEHPAARLGVPVAAATGPGRGVVAPARHERPLALAGAAQ